MEVRLLSLAKTNYAVSHNGHHDENCGVSSFEIRALEWFLGLLDSTHRDFTGKGV